MIRYLTKKEALFIYHAAWLSEGFLDFENNTDEQFKERYGITKDDVQQIEDSLKVKFKPISSELKAKTQ